MKIVEYKTWEYKELLKADRSRNELAKAMGITEPYDTALPQKWLDEFMKESNLNGHKILYSSFMVYAEDDIFGTVYSAWDECQLALNRDKLDWIKDVLADKYAGMIKKDLMRLCGVDAEYTPGEFSRAMSKMMQP